MLTSRITPAGAAFTIGVAAVTWAIVLPAATFAASRSDSGWWPRAGAAVAYLVGSVICHQRPERSFELWATVMPVCARCAGIYAGAALAAITVAVAAAGFRRTLARQGSSRTWSRNVLLLAASPALASLLYEWAAGDPPSNLVRAATGLVLGGGVMQVLFSAILAGAPASRTDAVN